MKDSIRLVKKCSLHKGISPNAQGMSLNAQGISLNAQGISPNVFNIPEHLSHFSLLE
jgi:predicted metal-binding protein